MSGLRARPGPTNSFTDIAGLKVGSAENEIIRSGTTVIVPDTPVAMAVDVRGGGPGTRDTEALDPSCLVDRVHGLVLSGGSVFGLAAADRLTRRLSDRGIGLPLGPRPVPVVPAAILFDLRNGGNKDWPADSNPYGDLADAALAALGPETCWGRLGAGYGALAGSGPGGLGTASLVTDSGIMVSALVALNCFGMVTDVAGGPAVREGEINLPKVGLVGANTTLAAVATNATLDKAALKRVAIMAHDGLARAIRPLHTPYDGDTVFAMATGAHASEKPLAATLTDVGALAADALVLAIRRLTTLPA